MAAARKPVNHFRATHLLRSAPGIQITIALKSEAMLFDAHVAHLHSFNQLVDGHAPSPLERVKDFQPLGAANFCD